MDMIKVTASLIVREGKILIARRSAGDNNLPNKWEFPGGKVESGESPQECLKRELEEELGITASIGDFLADSCHEYDHLSIRLMLYRAYWDKGELDPAVHDEVALVEREEMEKYDFAAADIPLVEKIISGEIPL